MKRTGKLWRNYLLFSAKILLSGLLLIWVLLKIEWGEMFFYLESIRWWQVAVYCGIVFSGILISVFRWRLFCVSKKIEQSFSKMLSFYFSGMFINNFMPSFIAGDAYKIYQIGKKNKCFHQATGTIMMDRITGFVSVVILSVFFAILNFKTTLAHPVIIWLNLGAIFFLLSDFLTSGLRKNNLVRKMAIKIIPETILLLFAELFSYQKKSKVFKKALLLSFVYSIVGVAIPDYLLFSFLKVQIGILDYFSIIFLIAVISVLPISINNIGLKEWAYIHFFGLFGVSATAAVAVAVISRFLNMGISFLALPLYLKSRFREKERRELELAPKTELS